MKIVVKNRNNISYLKQLLKKHKHFFENKNNKSNNKIIKIIKIVKIIKIINKK